MKKFMFCVLGLFLVLNSFSQYELAKDRIKRNMWSNNDPDFQITQCSDKWKNESAVILCKKYEYSVQKEILIGTAYENISTHTRLLLLDKAAVNEYSTFKFDISHDLGTYFGWGNNNSVYIGIKVVKADGVVKEVPIDEALIDEVTSSRSSQKTQKVAVPGLEVGDILDYYYVREKALPVQYFYPFSPVIYPLVDDYPIMKHKIEMHIMRRCYLNARSMNGAPQLEFQEDSKRKDMVYTITDIDRDKVKVEDQILLYPLRELPVLIFQAYFVNSPIAKNNFCFYDREGVIKKDVTESEIKEFLNNNLNYLNDKPIRKTVKYVKKLQKTTQDPKVLAREAYYFYRQFVYAQNFKLDMTRGYYKNYPPSEYTFVKSMSQILRRFNIKHSVVATVPRELSKMEDLIMPNQFGLLIRLDVDTPMYISAFSRFSLFNDLDDSYQGNKAEALKMHDLMAENRYISSITIPVKNYKENSICTTLDVSFEPSEADKLLLSRNVNATGWTKKYFQRTVIAPKDFVKFNSGKYGYSMDEDWDVEHRFTQFNTQEENKREVAMNTLVKEDFDVSDIKETKLELIQPGCWDDAPALIFNDSLEINKFITKAGDNIMLEVGKLIGKQIIPQASDSLRNYNIYNPCARESEYIMKIQIPEGYTVKGANNLVFNVTNETGGFVSSAVIEGKMLIVKTTKYFTNNYYEKENWSKIKSFLSAVGDFQNQKVMFAPGK